MDRTVLDEAKELVHGDRNDAYGPPSEDGARFAGMMNGLFLSRLRAVRDGRLRPEEFFGPTDYPRVQIVAKLSRSMHSHRRDTWTDIAGYAELADWIEEDSPGVSLA